LVHTIQTEKKDNPDKKLKPFVISLEQVNERRFEILNSVNSAIMHSGLVTLGKDECIGEHSTGNHEELIVIIEGKGEIEAEVNGRKKIGKGEAAYNPPHTKHNVYNTNSEVLKYIYIVAKV
jgi:quercetin dioxygenase-like cupin family protein